MTDAEPLDWGVAMYQATALLGWSHAEFWRATPALLEGQLTQHARAMRRSHGGKRGRRQAKPVRIRYADELPEGVW